MSVNYNLFKEHPNEVFVESGSCIGEGIQLALDAGFKRIISIEAQVNYYWHCIDRFKNNKQVELILGESNLVLFDILKDINVPITFWLDAHYSGLFQAQGKDVMTFNSSPLIEELEAIGKHHIKTHTILIDDMRCFNHLNLEEKLCAINKDYKITYRDGHIPNDILQATP